MALSRTWTALPSMTTQRQNLQGKYKWAISSSLNDLAITEPMSGPLKSFQTSRACSSEISRLLDELDKKLPGLIQDLMQDHDDDDDGEIDIPVEVVASFSKRVRVFPDCTIR